MNTFALKTHECSPQGVKRIRSKADSESQITVTWSPAEALCFFSFLHLKSIKERVRASCLQMISVNFPSISDHQWCQENTSWWVFTVQSEANFLFYIHLYSSPYFFMYFYAALKVMKLAGMHQGGAQKRKEKKKEHNWQQHGKWKPYPVV